MAVWSEVGLSEIEGAGRIDAEYYQPIYIKERAALRALPHIRLGNVAYVTDGQHGYHVVDPDSDIKHITARCVVDNVVIADNADRLGIETHLKNMRSSLETGDVLLQTAGTIGNAGVVTEDVLPANIDQDVARICIHDKVALSPWYVSVFINSTLGQMQTTFEATGQVQKHLSLGAVRQLLIPLLPQQDVIADIAIRANERRFQSKALYAEAENLLLHELGLDTLDLSHELTYERDFKEVAAADRFDAQFFQPKYQKVVDALSKHWTVEAIGSWGKVLKGRSVGEYTETGVPVIRSGDLTDIENVEGFKNASPADDLFYLERGDVCISSIGFGSIGKVQVFDKEEQSYATVSEVTVVRQSRVNPYYLQFFLQSLAGQLQIEKWITGATGQLHLYPRDVGKFVVPILPEAKQFQFEEIVNKARQTKQDAKQLLEDAKRQVERLILGEEAERVA